MRAFGVALVAGLLAASPAAAATPTYHSPHYKGHRKPPKTAAPATPAPIPLTASGRYPNLVVDAAGTAHIAWVEDGTTGPDAIVYCRIKRGEKACDSKQTFIPQKSYDPGDFPRANVDNNGPRVIAVGDQIAILSHRYPTVYKKPDDSSESSTTLLWVSDDGGNTFTGPGVVGDAEISGGPGVAFGTDDHPLIGVISDTQSQGTIFQALSPGAYTSAEADLSTSAPYAGTLALNGNKPVAAFTDLDDNIFIRGWTGAGDPNDVATWTPPTTTKGEDPRLAGGPGGLYLMSRPAYAKPLTVAKVGANLAAGPPVPVSGKQIGTDPAITEDPSGRVLAAWEATDAGVKAGVRLTTAADGTHFGSPRTLFDGNSIGQLRLGATSDGGGFAVANLTQAVYAGPLAAVGFGPTAATGKPGLGGLAGSGGDPNATSSCTTLGFGDVQATSPAGCFLHGTGAYAKVDVSTSEVDLNGLRLVPDAGVSISIDPRTHTLDTSGAVSVLLVNGSTSITLWHGELHVKLPTGTAGTTLFSFDTSQFGVDVLGFGVAGKVDVILTKTGVRIPISLDLPPVFGGIHGDAVLLADRGTGLHLDSLNIHIGNVFLGPLFVDHVDIHYTSGGDVWDGDGEVSVVSGADLNLMEVRFEHGAYKRGSFTFTFPPPGIVIGPAVYLTQIGGSLALDPTIISATAKIGAGTPGVDGTSPVNVDGTFTMSFPKTGPADFKMTGAVSFFLFQIGHGFLDFQSDGYAGFGGTVGGDFGPLHIDGNTDGFVDAGSGKFGASVAGKTCIDLKLSCVGLSSELAVSNDGFAACASALGVTGGVEFPFSDFQPVYLANPALLTGAVIAHFVTPCHASRFHVPPRPARRQAGGGLAVSVPAGLPSETFAVDGQQAPVTVTGPTKPAYTLTPAGTNTTYVVVTKPAAGAYTVAPATGLRISDGYVAAAVKARLKGHAIHYTVAHGGDGRDVQFAETGVFGTHLLGVAKGKKGTLHFAPALAKGGKRSVVALIRHDGMVTDRKTVGTYVAKTPPRPGRVTRLHAKLKHGRVKVSWRGGAKRYAVTVVTSHGMRDLHVVKTKRFNLSGLRGNVKISVAALDRYGRPAAARTVKAR